MAKLVTRCPNCNQSSDILIDRNIIECIHCGYNFVMESCRRISTDFKRCNDCETRFKCWSQARIN
jgi:primosomal protein N'